MADYAAALTIGMIRSMLEASLDVPTRVFHVNGEIVIVCFGNVGAPMQGRIFDELKAWLPSGLKQTWRFFPEAGDAEVQEAVEAAFALGGHAAVSKLIDEAQAAYVAKCTCPTCGYRHVVPVERAKARGGW